MNLVRVRDTHLGYISVSQIVDESPFRFRRPNAEAVEDLRLSFLRSGQTHPMLLETLSDGNFRVLDGHRRLAAVRSIHARGGSWHKILAYLTASPTPIQIFRSLLARNDGDGAYAPTELGRLLAWAQGSGIETSVIARGSGLSLTDVDDLLDLAEAPEDLAAVIDKAGLAPLFAAMLFRRFRSWRATRHGPFAIETASRLIEQSKKSALTIKGWRFLLDFYWADDRPFMIGSYEKDRC